MRLSRPHRRQLGLGLVELMVGITVGLIVAAGASMVAVNQINEHRRLMLETQVQQDLRTAADLLQQDLRRAGFRGQAALGVWAPATAVGSQNEQAPKTALPNSYADFSIATSSETGTEVTYLYALKANATGVPASNEHFGFKWDRRTQTLYLQLGLNAAGQANWQPITDPDNLLITDFDISLNDKPDAVTLGEFCDKPCSPLTAGAPACPSLKVREVSFRIVGQAKHDANVVRTLKGSERIRANDITGACPT